MAMDRRYFDERRDVVNEKTRRPWSILIRLRRIILGNACVKKNKPSKITLDENVSVETPTGKNRLLCAVG